MDPGGGGAQVTGDDRPEEVARGDVVAPTERGDERRERAHQGRDDAEPLIDQTPPREETEPARPEADPSPAVREAVARPAPQIGGRAPERIAVHDLDGRRDSVGHVEHAAAVRGEPVPRALVIPAEHLVRVPEPVVEHHGFGEDTVAAQGAVQGGLQPAHRQRGAVPVAIGQDPRDEPGLPSQMKQWLETLHRLPILAFFWISTKAPILVLSPTPHP